MVEVLLLNEVKWEVFDVKYFLLLKNNIRVILYLVNLKNLYKKKKKKKKEKIE